MTNNEIIIAREKYQIQLEVAQLQAIVDQLNNGCNFLVFGVGNDSEFWLQANKNGQTIFIEDDNEWADIVKTKNPDIKIIMVEYQTKRINWRKLINQPKKLMLDLPAEIRNTSWDVILVDAPRGYEDFHPGRMKSIYEALRLIKNHGHIFVHDCDRQVEREYTDKYLLKYNLVKQINSLRHYLINKDLSFFDKLKFMNKKKIAWSLVFILFIMATVFLVTKKTIKDEVVPVIEKAPEIVVATSTVLATTTEKMAEQKTSLANPASTNCQDKGGKLEIQTKEDGSQYGLCYFDDARACEEWAMFRGDCPVGGVKTTGYDTLAQKYCAWLGGKTIAEADAICTFKDDSSCLDSDLYLGACQKGDWPKK